MFIPSGVAKKPTSFVSAPLPGLPDGPVMHYDASDISTLWQDAGRTTPVTATDQTVGAWDPVETNGGTGNYLSGSAEYVDGSIGFGPGVRITGTISEQVAGSGGGAVPPGGADPRFVMVVASSASAKANSTEKPYLAHWGGTNGTDQNWTMGSNGSSGNYNTFPAFVATGDRVSSGSQAAVTAYPCPNAVVMAWYDGSNIVVSQDGVESSPHAIALNTVTSGTDATKGLRIGNYVGENWPEKPVIHELAVYDFVPSSAERALILSYAKNKWAPMGEQYALTIDASKPETLRNGAGQPASYGESIANVRTSTYANIAQSGGTNTKVSTAYGDALRISSGAFVDYECETATNTNGSKTFVVVVSNISGQSGSFRTVFGHGMQTNQFSAFCSFFLRSRQNSQDFWGVGFEGTYGSVGWVTTDAPSTGLGIVFAWSDGAGNTYVQVNGGTVHSNFTTPLNAVFTQRWQIGGGAGTLDFHESRVWSRQLSTNERNAIYSELTAKWGTP